MAKKKAAAKKPAGAPDAPKQTKKAKRPTSEKAPAIATGAGSVKMHAYRHEILENPNNAPLVVEIPITDGRGDNPPTPAFVTFTAEMSEDYWPDQFAFRLVSLSGGSVRVMISRVDKGPAELGWGVKLVVHVLVVDISA